MRRLYLVGIGALLCASCAGCGAPTAQSVAQYEQVTALVLAETQIRAQLKSPATASFPVKADSITETGPRQYHIESHVDAENSFGANLRQTWTADVTIYGDNTGKVSAHLNE